MCTFIVYYLVHYLLNQLIYYFSLFAIGLEVRPGIELGRELRFGIQFAIGIELELEIGPRLHVSVFQDIIDFTLNSSS